MSLTDFSDDELDAEDDDFAAPPQGQAPHAPGADLEDDDVSEEEEARAQGWRPLGEFKGDPATHVSAADFLARARDRLPLANDQVHRLSQKIAKMERRSAERDGELERLRANQATIDARLREADQAGYDRALQELENRRRQAIHDGDDEAFDEADAGIRDIERKRGAAPAVDPATGRPAAPPPPPPPAGQPPANPEIAAFVSANPWFTSDPGLQAQMIGIHDKVGKENPTMPLADQLREAKRRLILANPDDEAFENEAPMPSRPTAPSVSRPSPPRAPGERRSVWDRLPEGDRADARAQWQRQKANDPDLSAQEYVHLYMNPHADVLAVQKQYRKKA